MSVQKYTVNQYSIQIILSWIRSGEIAIPEIQRPFVWDSSQVRDFIDSLYNGYPVGYLITWKNPDIRLKDGTKSQGKKILIDGQQRVTALMAVLIGMEVINKEYKTGRIKIAFHPLENKFEVSNPAIEKSSEWIKDISILNTPEFQLFKFAENHAETNSCDKETIFKSLDRLRNIHYNSIGVIELGHDLDIETVTEIFIRINSKGVVLSQADFAMSKIAVNETYGGNELRKAIEYFSHLAVYPEFYKHIENNDKVFAYSEYYKKMSWLKKEKDDIYDPSYNDILRVAFISKFKRGRLRDLVALLSGRDFEKKTYEESIVENSFKLLKNGIIQFMDETNFKNYIMIVKSTGFIVSSMIRSQNVLNAGYIVYLVGRYTKINKGELESVVSRWIVMSILKGRYSASPESQFDYDIKRINEVGLIQYLAEIEESEFSESYWNASLPIQMNTSVASSPFFNVYLAAQVKSGDKGFLSKSITVQSLLENKGDIHHIFPKNYLIKNRLNRGNYNQIANYVIMQSEINITIKDRAPSEYFKELLNQCGTGNAIYGAICNLPEMEENFKAHCIPNGIEDKDFNHYEDFLQQRRKLMAAKIKEYYNKL
jgi:hypothetical protein